MSALKKVWCNGQLIEVSDEVYTAYIKGERKGRYFTEDLKMEQIIIVPETQTIRVIPSREDSLDRLMEENNRQFSDHTVQVEEYALQKGTLDELYKAISLLKREERELIHALFFNGYTERAWAEHTGVHYMTIHCRKVRILSKLKKLMKI